MVKKILVTGCSGILGTLTKEQLSSYELCGADVKKSDFPNFKKVDVARDYSILERLVKGKDAVIHFAWDSRENFANEVVIPENKIMVENVYKAALKTKPHPRVIMASSIHAATGLLSKEEILKGEISDIRKNEIGVLKTDYNFPSSPYGETKVHIENLGRKYAKKGLNIICIRFGAPDNVPKPKSFVWLSKENYQELIEKCVKTKNLPKFSIFYGVSNNTNNIFDLSNTEKI